MWTCLDRRLSLLCAIILSQPARMKLSYIELLPRGGRAWGWGYDYYINDECTWQCVLYCTLYERMVRCNSQSSACNLQIMINMVQNVLLTSFPSPHPLTWFLPLPHSHFSHTVTRVHHLPSGRHTNWIYVTSVTPQLLTQLWNVFAYFAKLWHPVHEISYIWTATIMQSFDIPCHVDLWQT